MDLAQRMKAKRWSILIGQAGDRDDASIQELTRLTAVAAPDRAFIKEMEVHLRGRPKGEIPAMIEAELKRNHFGSYEHHSSELAAVKAALQWAKPGDLVVLPVHASRDEVTALLEDLRTRQWRVGRSDLVQPLPKLKWSQENVSPSPAVPACTRYLLKLLVLGVVMLASSGCGTIEFKPEPEIDVELFESLKEWVASEQISAWYDRPPAEVRPRHHAVLCVAGFKTKSPPSSTSFVSFRPPSW